MDSPFVQHVLELRQAAGPWIDQILNNLPGSDLFVMVVLTERDRQSPEVALQLGTALLLGLPMFIFAGEGVQLPAEIGTLAKAIVRCNPDDPASREDGVQRLRAHMEGYGRRAH